MPIETAAINDIHGFNKASMDQVMYLEALFKAIARLDNQQTVGELAQLGIFVAATLHNDIDIFDEPFRS